MKRLLILLTMFPMTGIAYEDFMYSSPEADYISIPTVEEMQYYTYQGYVSHAVEAIKLDQQRTTLCYKFDKIIEVLHEGKSMNPRRYRLDLSPCPGDKYWHYQFIFVFPERAYHDRVRLVGYQDVELPLQDTKKADDDPLNPNWGRLE